MNKAGFLGNGKIIGFTKRDPQSLYNNTGYSVSNQWFAIVENEIIGQPSSKLLDCKFVLVPTADITPKRLRIIKSVEKI